MNKINNIQKIWFFLLVFCLQSTILAAPAQIEKVRFSVTPEKTRLVFDLSDQVNYTIAKTTPETLQLTLQDAKLGSEVAAKQIYFAKTPIKSLMAKQQCDSLILTLELQREVGVKHFLLANPDRLVIDLVEVQLQAKPVATKKSPKVMKMQPKVISKPVVKPLIPKPKSIVITNTEPTPTVTVNVKPKTIVITNDAPTTNVTANVNDTDAVPIVNVTTVPVAAKEAVIANTTNITEVPKLKPVVLSETQTNTKCRDIIVVIDPGHGGKDPGATGHNGAKEKNVVFGVAKNLQQIIDKTPGFKAVLTRKGDYFISLRQRLNIAHQYKADMFVAIHADAYNVSNSRGASVFALSQRGATSEAARWLADRENESELGQAMSDKSNVLRSVLIDLAQTATIGASLEIGNAILDGLEKFTRLHSGKVEQAAFVVLKSPDIPSLLVETGFISDTREEAKLRTCAYQRQLAAALAHGIENYFIHRPPPGTYLALHRKSN